MGKQSRRPRARAGFHLFAAAYRAAHCADCGHPFIEGEDKKLSVAYDPASGRILDVTALCLACHRTMAEHMRLSHGIVSRDLGRVGS